MDKTQVKIRDIIVDAEDYVQNMMGVIDHMDSKEVMKNLPDALEKIMDYFVQIGRLNKENKKR